MKYNTIEQITKAFIKDGWDNPTFTMINAMDIKKAHGTVNIKPGNYFVMNETGNIYTNTGKIYLYNIKPAKCY
jgi:hypothetical protein